MYNLTFSSYVFILLVISFFLLIHLISISSLTLIQGFDVVIELICLILLLIEFIVSFVGGHCSIAAFLCGLLLLRLYGNIYYQSFVSNLSISCAIWSESSYY